MQHLNLIIQRKVQLFFFLASELYVSLVMTVTVIILTQEVCQNAQEGETHLEEDAGDHPHVDILVTPVILTDVILDDQDVTEYHRVCKVVRMDQCRVQLHLALYLSSIIFHLDMKRIKRVG